MSIYEKEIKPRRYVEYMSRMFSEKDLFDLAKEILANEKDIQKIAKNLLIDLSNEKPYNRYFDWNIGSTIQHFNPSDVLSAFKEVNSLFLTDSIGLSWVFGEFKLKDQVVIDFLYEVILKGRDSEAWWRAAFSLEKIGIEDAVVLLKRGLKSSGLKSLNYYLENLDNKKSIIGILLRSSNFTLRSEIYPRLKDIYVNSNDTPTLINCSWLLGRFKLIDNEILEKLISTININKDYELVYYTYFAIQELANPALSGVFERFLEEEDALLRKMAVRGLSYIPTSENQLLLETLFNKETSSYVLAEISQSLYRIQNAKTKKKISLIKKHSDIENGLIIDDTDKWYADPSIYEEFSNAEDPENVCFKLIEKEIKNRLEVISNPIDLATGTGRALRYFVNNLSFEGSFYAVDRSTEMLKYLEKILNRNQGYVQSIELIEGSLDSFDIGIKSNFIISSFGFPSKFTNKQQCLVELERVYNHLTNDGLFVTLGWDETFNDELNYYWFRHIPDEIGEFDFEKWRLRRMSEFDSPRNCGLAWFKKGIIVPLQFDNLEQAVKIIGNLFGRDAAKDIVLNERTEWSMALGITLNTKEELYQIIKNHK